MTTEGSPLDLPAFTRTVDAAVATAASLDDVVLAIAAVSGVVSVRVADYLLKSHPPRRDVHVDVRSGPGTTAGLVVQITELGDRRFALHEVRARAALEP